MEYKFIPSQHRTLEEISADLGAIAQSALDGQDGPQVPDIPENIILGEERADV